MKKKLKKPRAWQAACCPNTVPVQDLFPLWFTVVKLGMLLREVYSCTSFFTSSHWTVTQEKYYMGHENDPFFGLDSVSQNFTFSLLMQQHFYTFIRAIFSANDCGRFYGTLISYLLVIVQMSGVRIDIAYMVLWYCIFTEFESRIFMIEINCKSKISWKTNFLWPFILTIILHMAE